MNDESNFDFIGFWDDEESIYYVILDSNSGKVVVSRVSNREDSYFERVKVSLLLYLKIKRHSCI